MTRQLALAGILLAATHSLWAQDDPPARVGRLSYLTGTVSFQPAGSDDWAGATLNYPITTGDRLWADDQSRAEVHIGSSAIRLSMRTAFSFLNLDDNMVQVRLSEGALDITIRDLQQGQAFEVDTPNAAISLLRPGRYRIDGDPENMRTRLTVRAGEAEVTAGGFTVPIHNQQAADINGEETASTNLIALSPPDAFDRWVDERSDRESRRPPPRYVSREMVGYEDLDANGDWLDEPEYGHVWAPRVAAGWAPYHDGRWAWVEPWGWTWIDDAPWGFAPFHYGRWASLRGRWVWVPGVVEARPVYAPALVAFVGGGSWSASLSFGGGVGVGWFPLGPREVYRPSYQVSNNYVTRINETHVTNVTNITNVNVTNVTYVNQRVPGAVTAVSQADFASSRSVARVAKTVPTAAVASAGITGTAPQVAPRAPGILAAPAAGARPVARPPQAALNRPVVTKTQPPPPAVPFAARQAALTANPGKPVAPAALSEMRRTQPAPVQLVKPAPPSRPAQPQQRGVQATQPAPVPAVQPGAPQRGVQPAPPTQASPVRPGAPPRVEQPQRSVQPAQAPPVQTPTPPRVEQPQRNVQPTPAPPVQPATPPRVEQPQRATPATPARPDRPDRPDRQGRAERPPDRAQPAQAAPASPARPERTPDRPPERTRPPQAAPAQPATPPRAEPQRVQPTPPPAAQREAPQRAEQPRQQRPEGRPATTPEEKQKGKKREEEKK